MMVGRRSSPFLGPVTFHGQRLLIFLGVSIADPHKKYISIKQSRRVFSAAAARGMSSTPPSVPGQRCTRRSNVGSGSSEIGRRKRAADAMESHGWRGRLGSWRWSSPLTDGSTPKSYYERICFVPKETFHQKGVGEFWLQTLERCWNFLFSEKKTNTPGLPPALK